MRGDDWPSGLDVATGVISTTVIPAHSRAEYREKGEWMRLNRVEADLVRQARADANKDCDPGDCTDHAEDRHPDLPHFSTATPDHPLYERHLAVGRLMKLIASGEIDEYEADRRLAAWTDAFDTDAG